MISFTLSKPLLIDLAGVPLICGSIGPRVALG